MKLFLALLLVVGAALGNSIHRYAWQPQREYVYRYESKVDFSIPEIRANHKAGLRLSSVLRVQAKSDYSLLIKFDQPRFLTFNGVQESERREEREEPIPQEFKTALEQPFKVHLRRGVVESIFVERDEPIAITNIKKAVLATLNMDLSASRRNEILSNRLEIPDEQTLDLSAQGQSYFTTREQSLHGDCQTSYNIHPLAEYEAMEIEEQMMEKEKERNQREHLQGGLSSGRQVCQDKKYWQITKTRNFDNCVETPVFQKWSGLKAKCDTTRASCNDLMTHVSSTNYVVCGSSINDFVIRKSVTLNTISSQIGWKTEERFQNTAQVVLELLKEETFTTPFNVQNTKEIKSLIFEYPERSMTSSKSLNSKLSESVKDQLEQESGIRPILPKPDLRSAPQMLVAVKLEKDEIYRQVMEQLQRVAQEIFESPESCTSKGDVAGHLSIVAKALRPLSLDELKQMEVKLEAQISSKTQEHKRLIRNLFYDVVSMIGTNPAVMLVRERVKDTTRVESYQAVKMIQITMSSVRTPTQELLKELIELVKEDIKPLAHDRTQVYNIALVQMSNLLHKACVSPTKENQYPVKVYGQFCSAESSPIQTWLQFLRQEFNTQQNQQIRLNTVAAIGKVGAIKSIEILAEIVQSNQHNEMVRALAVYSLQRSAKMQPMKVKPMLLNIIDNAAERVEVRIAAVAVLPYAQPTTAELQKIAVRTWLEPSKEYTSFVYSTFTSLIHTQIPELRLVGQKMAPLVSLIKPLVFGLHYSHNVHSSKLVQYLQMALDQEYSWVKSKDSVVPHRFSMKNLIYTGSAELNGASYTFYTRGMDKWIDMIMRYTSATSQTSQFVQQELEKIVRELNMVERTQPRPEIFTQMKMFDYEYSLYLNENTLVQAIEQITEELNKDMQSITEKKTFELTRVSKLLEAEGLGPCDAGFPVYIERTIPMVVALKGYAEMELEEQNAIRMPKMLKAKIIPVVNIKMEANMGVISPFNQKLIGNGVEIAAHSAAPLELILRRKLAQLSLDIKLPDEVTRELEAVHVFVTPFSVQKDLRKIEPVSKASDLKIILSGEPLKEVKRNIGQALEIDAKLLATSDAKYTDLYSYWEKIQQHNFNSLMNSFYLPSTLRMSSMKIIFNPQSSRTKEVSLTFGLVKVNKEQGQQETQVFPAMLSAQPVDDMSHIKQVCIENYPRNPAKFSDCVIELSTLEFVTDSVDSVCKAKRFPKCEKMESVCHKAKTMCETKTGFRSQMCQRNAETCLRRILNLQSVHKTLEQLGQEGKVVSLRLDADLRGSNKALSTAFTFGMKKERSTPEKEEVKLVSNVEVKTSQSPVYEVKVISKAEIPRVNNRWNREQLLQQLLKLVLNAEVEYGYESRTKETVKINSEMIKSEAQIKSVRGSPEYRRCDREEQEGQRLANVCEFARHQAASIDQVMTEIHLPKSLYKYPVMVRIGQFIRAYFVGQMYETESSQTSENMLRLKAMVSRVGDEAQISAEVMGRKFEIVNLRMPTMLKGVLPISMRNPLRYNLMQKITRHQIPASCRVEPRFISTFDNKTFGYELNDCYHLLFKDCSQRIPVAVLAKKLTGEEKQVKILSGPIQVKLIPVNGQMKVELNVEGRQEEVRVQPGRVHQIKDANNQVIMEVKRYADNVYLVNAIRESLWVLFDGKRIEVSGSYMLRSRACGLCGDLNGENTADLKTPEMCLMSRPRFAAYSYMIQESCQGIPSQDRSRYQQEKSECVKEEVIPTPLERLSKIVLAPEGTKPVISQHLVQRQNQSGQVCISVQKVKVCSKINKNETEEPRPVKVQRRRIQYICYLATTQLAQQLEQRARAGESLELTAAGQPVAFSKIEYEPTLCHRQSNQI